MKVEKHQNNFIYVYVYIYITSVTFLVFSDGFFGNVFPTAFIMKQDFKYCQRQKSELKSNYTYWKTSRYLEIRISLQNAFTTAYVSPDTTPGLQRLVDEHPCIIKWTSFNSV